MAQDNRWVTSRPTPIYNTLGDRAQKNVFEWIPERIIVVTKNEDIRRSSDGSEYRYVAVPACPTLLNNTAYGWMNIKDIVSIDITLKKDEKTALALQMQTFDDFLKKAISDEKAREEIKEKFSEAAAKEVKEINLLKSGGSFADLIRVAGEEQRSILQQAQESYEINVILLPEKQRYEPYFARARAWAKFGYYPEAMFDYLDGLQVIKRIEPIVGQPENAFLLYEKYFKEMTEKVRLALNQPFNVTQMGRGTRDTAGHYFSQGYTAFWNGDYEDALKKFDNAIAVEFYVPVYWYYRGLAYKRLGNPNKEIYCFLIASQMEKATVDKRKEEPEWEQRYVAQVNSSKHLERFQGNDRMWLEQIRWGDPSNELWKKYFENESTTTKGVVIP